MGSGIMRRLVCYMVVHRCGTCRTRRRWEAPDPNPCRSGIWLLGAGLSLLPPSKNDPQHTAALAGARGLVQSRGMSGHFQPLALSRMSLRRELPGDNTEFLIALEERAPGNARSAPG